ncbi:MAG: cell division protein FtsQ/DivIB [Alphaproteobacteria bacterium]
MKKRTQTKRPKIQVKRQRFTLEDFKRRLRLARNLAISLIIVGIPAAIWVSGSGPDLIRRAHNFTVNTAGGAGLNVQDILVEGRERTKQEDILQVLGVQRNSPILSLDPQETKSELEQLPWVKSAIVQRRLPDTIYVRLSERRPIALWQKQSKLFLIDADGHVIDNFDKKKFAKMLIVIGDGAPKEAASLIRELNQFPGLKERVTSATFVSNRRWDLMVDHKLKIKLPEDDMHDALLRLAKMHHKHPFNAKQFATIDVRLPDRSFLTMAANQDLEKGKKT